MVAQFRATHDVWAGDPAFTELCSACASGRKSLHHPKLSLLQFEYTSFQANDDPALKLVIYTPV
jgi:hypothetical protein